MGVSGSGKSTLAEMLARALQVDYVDADDLHPEANKVKMAGGTPLTDEDRWPWLRSVGEVLHTENAAGRSVVVACSALRRSYRDVLREKVDDAFLIHLHGDEELLAERLGMRKGHFMPVALLASQLATLEPLAPDEAGLVVDIALQPEEAVARVLAELGLVPAR
ncbi:MAG: gluconokinase [Actinomycetota bacterium]|nr:gluconokinase [Actinomycetota bacterium]